MLGYLRFGGGLPHYRLERLQADLGARLPASTQWELMAQAGQPLEPVHEALNPLAAQASGVAITNAAPLPYSGSSPGLTLTNAQGAIDQVASNTAALISQAPSNTGACINSQAPRIVLPDEFAAVVGDKLQLFVRGMIEAQDPHSAPYEIVCSKGAQYPRYFQYTPQAGDPASQTLTVTMPDGD